MVNKELFDNSAWFIAIGASEFLSAPISDINSIDETRLLELRVFDEEHEIKRVRGSLDEDFQERDSKNIEYDRKHSETQYLDIDSSKTSGDFVRAIGGGEYRLPSTLPDMLEIQHYYKSDYMGFYHPFDFRIVRFLNSSKKGD